MGELPKDFDFGDFLNGFVAKNGKSASVQSNTYDDSPKTYDWRKLYESTLADFNSYKKRILNQKETEKRNMLKELMLGFLDLVDYMQYAYRAKNTTGTYTTEDDMLFGKLLSFLAQYDVHPMLNLKGTKFDHRFHEAVAVDKNGADLPPDIIVQVISNGFLFGTNEVLRPAKVIVSA